ncbi:MAG TPA: hypothetical protein VHG08_16550 [Longimicrobium sp.]|nr:hypothetical protein [Longimicrobium sp.]
MSTTRQGLLARLIKHAWLAPVAAVTVLFWLTIWIYSHLAPLAAGWGGNAARSDAASAEFESLSGMLWGSSAILFLSTTAAAAAVLVFTICRSYKDHVNRRPSPGEALLVLVALALPVAPVLLPPFNREPFVTMEVVRLVLDPSIIGVVDFLWIATMLAAFLVMGGAAASLLATAHIRSRIQALPPREWDDDRRSRLITELAGSLQSQSRRLQAVLFAGAAVLVAGVLEIDALYGWAISVADLRWYPREAGRVITASATVPTGTFFSLFLAAAYIPAALILRQQAAALAATAVGAVAAAEQSRWLQDNGLTTSIATQVSSLVALLGPILAGAPLNAMAQAFG